MALMKRTEMNPAFQWDLTPVYPSIEAWEADYRRADAQIATLPELEGTLCASKEALRAGFETIDACAERVERLLEYAFLKKAGDNSDPDAQACEARVMALYTRYQAALAFVRPELLSSDVDSVRAYLQDPSMGPVRHRVEDILRARSHTLSPECERLLALLTDAAQTPSNVFEMFESVDMRFEDLLDDDGHPLPLTHGTFGVYREHPSREVRRRACEAYAAPFQAFINTLAASYTGSVKQDCYFASVRNFESARAAALFENAVPESLYDALIDIVHANLPTMADYLALRREVLKVDTLHMYDVAAPMVESVEIKVSYEEACAIVREALRPLGEAYGTLLDRAFSERWIDVYENQGKTTGAFSSGVYGVHPYVLLNYTDTLDDVFTLAHELGHAMHSWHSDAAQDFGNHDYAIFVAEVASTVNEVLLTMHLLKTEQDPARRLYILNHFLEGFRTTVFRQTQFAEFEQKAHAMNESGVPLTSENLSQMYRTLNALYYPGVELDAYTDCEWARIPHFYNAFYVYQYATGFSSAVVIADRILNAGGAQDYLRFLSLGGSAYPIDELKVAGVDLTEKDALNQAMRVFRERFDEFARLIRSR